jgi:hypothetical protein
MNRRVASRLIAAFTLALPAAAGAQEKPTQQEIERLQQIMMAGLNPRAEHERLARLAGRWEQEIRMWPEPGAQPMTFTGTAENKMILGGRFLVSESTFGEGEMRGEGLTILGFDGRNEWYTAAGYDTWGTYHVAAKGVFDAARDAIVMRGSDSVEAGNHTQTWDFVLRTVDANTYVWEIIFTDPWHTKGGPPFRMVEITYRRRS